MMPLTPRPFAKQSPGQTCGPSDLTLQTTTASVRRADHGAADTAVIARSGAVEGGVLAIKGQRLAPGQFLAFARRFGRPEPHVINQFHYPGYPDILILSNRRNNGEPIGLADAGSYFHTDYSYLEVPARLTMLYSVEVPSHGGDTLFANMSAAYDDLAESMKRRIDHLVVLHHYGNRDDLDETRAPPPRS